MMRLNVESYIEGKSRAFLCRVIMAAMRLRLPDWKMLLAVMEFESGINPKAVNRHTFATGLIQFMPKTAKDLGTSVDALYDMTDTEQVVYVEAYLKPWTGKLKTVSDLYMAILWPSAVGKPEDYMLWEKNTKAYAQNPLDHDKNGFVTKAEASRIVQKIYDHMCREEKG